MTSPSDDAQVRTTTAGEGSSSVTYDVRGGLGAANADRPPLFMFASPMDAGGFVTLASHFTDRPVVTYDPRGAGRNPTDTAPITPEEHATDLHRVIAALGVGAVDLFGSSGGAVNLLALAAAHPEDVRVAVVHEPPLASLLPDRDVILEACRDLRATYDRAGHGPAMARFIGLVMADGELGSDYLVQPEPDPAMFGMSAEDDGSRDDPLMRNMPSCLEHLPDVGRLRQLGDRLVLAYGAQSGEQIAARGARAVATTLGLEPTVFPGGHAGFLGGEYGQTGDPDAFAARLREVLDR